MGDLRAILEWRESDHQTIALSRDSETERRGWIVSGIGPIVCVTESFIELAHEHPLRVPVSGGSVVCPGGERIRRPCARFRELRVPVLPVLWACLLLSARLLLSAALLLPAAAGLLRAAAGVLRAGYLLAERAAARVLRVGYLRAERSLRHRLPALVEELPDLSRRRHHRQLRPPVLRPRLPRKRRTLAPGGAVAAPSFPGR